MFNSAIRSIETPRVSARSATYQRTSPASFSSFSSVAGSSGCAWNNTFLMRSATSPASPATPSPAHASASKGRSVFPAVRMAAFW